MVALLRPYFPEGARQLSLQKGASVFNLKWQPFTPHQYFAALCGGTQLATEEWQVVTSPGYPRDYEPRMRCRWTLDAPPGERVLVEVTDLDIEEHPECRQDYLQLEDTPLVGFAPANMDEEVSTTQNSLSLPECGTFLLARASQQDGQIDSCWHHHHRCSCRCCHLPPPLRFQGFVVQ